METNVSIKNTKNEILSAYDDLLHKFREKKTEEPKKVQEQQKQENLVKNAAGMSYEGIVKDVSDLKVNLSSALDKLGEKFVTEFKKFEDLQQAIRIEQKNLEDLYQLSANVDSLSVMLLAQKEKKEQFEIEMAARKVDLDEKLKTEKERFETEIAEKRLQWKKEQDANQLRTKEETETTKKSRERNEEEYQYNLKTTRKKENDLYEEKKQKLEKELADKKANFEKTIAEREARMNEAESELKELRSRNAAFPSEQEKAINAAVKAASEKMEASFRFQIELKDKEVNGELRLKDQTIETLINKIKDLEANIKDLSQKAITADANVKDIAIKAIESNSKSYFIEKNKESLTKE